MDAKHFKEELTTWRLSPTGVKAVLIERISKTLNKNAPIIDVLKILEFEMSSVF